MFERIPGAGRCPAHRRALLLAIAAASSTPAAYGFEIGNDNPDLKIRWDNTFKYSAAWRVEKRSSALVDDVAVGSANIDLDDGDRNFDRGLISNRVDVLSELDLSYKQRLGARVSAAAWYDSVYNRSNDHDSPLRANQTSVPFDEFTDATEKIHGRKAELLDAFIWAKNEDGGLRLGRHSVLYGETLFFGANGIAGAQQPVDVVKLLSVPGSQFKEIILPVNQISAQYQIKSNLSVGAYYQFEWRKSRIPSSGSYFSTVDVLGMGSENFLFGPVGLAPSVARVDDLGAKDSGQGGVQLRWRPEGMDTEFGFYAARYHDKLPQAYLRPLGALGVPGAPANFQHVYPEGIKTYGMSFSTEVADFNLSGEVSFRRNAPLVSAPEVDLSPTGSAGINGDALYAVGKTAHANLSAIFSFNRNALWDSAMLLAEVAWNRVTSVTRNRAGLDPNSSRDAWGLRFILEPNWFQALPGLDLSMPIGVGYNPKGNSGAVAQFNGGVEKGGDFSIGVNALYQQVWKAGIRYTHYFGSEGPAVVLRPDLTSDLTFKQSLADRDFLSVTLQRSF